MQASSGGRELLLERRRVGDDQVDLVAVLVAEAVPAETAPGAGRLLAADCHAGERARQPPVRRLGCSEQRCPIRWGLGDQRREQRRPPTLDVARVRELRFGVALDRLGGELIDVREHRLGEGPLCLRARSGGGRRLTHAPPSDSRADPKGGLQPIEAASGVMLAVTEAAVDGARLLGFLADEAPQRDLGAGANPASEVPAQWARVGRNLALDRLHDLLGERGEIGANRGHGLPVEARNLCWRHKNARADCYSSGAEATALVKYAQPRCTRFR